MNQNKGSISGGQHGGDNKPDERLDSEGNAEHTEQLTFAQVQQRLADMQRAQQGRNQPMTDEEETAYINSQEFTPQQEMEMAQYEQMAAYEEEMDETAVRDHEFMVNAPINGHNYHNDQYVNLYDQALLAQRADAWVQQIQLTPAQQARLEEFQQQAAVNQAEVDGVHDDQNDKDVELEEEDNEKEDEKDDDDEDEDVEKDDEDEDIEKEGEGKRRSKNK